MACRALGDDESARRYGEKSLARWREAGDVHGLVAALHVLAWLALDRGDAAAAADVVRAGLEVSQRIGHRRGIGRSLDAAARWAAVRGRLAAAPRLNGAGDAVLDAISSPRAPDEAADERRTLDLLAGCSELAGGVEHAVGRPLGEAEAARLALDLLRAEA
jgi:hypothetical protein